MAITRADVEKVSLLARLQLTDAEIDTLTGELGQIVAYVDQLSEVDTEGVAPMAHAVEVSNVFASDEVKPSLPREQALANAPSHNERGYLVPPVMGG
jgi:aspartyl-tRNA(Asn)/glutamyl-tRNA(Gln) amidotransferase subunit C